jgi:hypothetical protein
VVSRRGAVRPQLKNDPDFKKLKSSEDCKDK